MNAAWCLVCESLMDASRENAFCARCARFYDHEEAEVEASSPLDRRSSLSSRQSESSRSEDSSDETAATSDPCSSLMSAYPKTFRKHSTQQPQIRRPSRNLLPPVNLNKPKSVSPNAISHSQSPADSSSTAFSSDQASLNRGPRPLSPKHQPQPNNEVSNQLRAYKLPTSLLRSRCSSQRTATTGESHRTVRRKLAGFTLAGSSDDDSDADSDSEDVQPSLSSTTLKKHKLSQNPAEWSMEELRVDHQRRRSEQPTQMPSSSLLYANDADDEDARGRTRVVRPVPISRPKKYSV